jgi:hypothetical protein
LLSDIASAKRSLEGKNASRAGQVELLPLAPRAVEDGRDQDVLAALDRIGVDAEEPQQARRGGADALAQQLLVFPDGGRGGRERLQDGERDPRVAARRVDREVGRVAQALDPRAVLPPGREPLLPQLGLLARVVVHREVLAARVVLVDPGAEVVGLEAGEGEEQIGEVALGIDEDGRDAVDGRLLDERQAEAGLAAAGHAHADRVGDQVLRVVEDEAVLRFLLLPVVGPAQVEDAQLLEVGGARHAEPSG